MSTLRSDLRDIVETLLAASVVTQEVSLDSLGHAIGSRAVSYVEVDAMIAALEAAGRTVTGATDDLRGEAHLRAVVTSLRTLTAELGRRPTLQEIAHHSALSLEQVRHALVLARVMQR